MIKKVQVQCELKTRNTGRGLATEPHRSYCSAEGFRVVYGRHTSREGVPEGRCRWNKCVEIKQFAGGDDNFSGSTAGGYTIVRVGEESWRYGNKVILNFVHHDETCSGAAFLEGFPIKV